jgi:hypothetical protein
MVRLSNGEYFELPARKRKRCRYCREGVVRRALAQRASSRCSIFFPAASAKPTLKRRAFLLNHCMSSSFKTSALRRPQTTGIQPTTMRPSTLRRQPRPDEWGAYRHFSCSPVTTVSHEIDRRLDHAVFCVVDPGSETCFDRQQLQ